MYSRVLPKLILTSSLIFSNTIFAKTLTQTSRVSSSFSDNEKVMTKALFGEFSKRGAIVDKLYQSKKIKEVIQIKQVVEVPEEYEVEEVKTLGRGESIVERQKAKVRAELAKKSGEDRPLTGKEKIQQMLAKNREKLKEKKSQKDESEMDIYQLAKKNERELIEQRDKMDKQLEAWADEYQKNLEKWAKAREEFLQRIDEVKNNLEDLEESDYQPITKKIKTKKVRMVKKEVVINQELDKEITTQIPEGVHYVAGALEVDIRDQSRRPTCSSFTGIRAIEILLKQNGIDKDLSEQYFYWASKPQCQSSPCTAKGSWVGNGYDYSINQRSTDIPEEKDCPYTPNSKSSNETQIPLDSGCRRGAVKVVDYEYVQDLNKVAIALKSNFPVVASIKLTENFYNNEGLVFKSEIPSSFGSKDGHAEGHSVLLVGMMKLPKELKNKEGEYCFLTANSWGVGWGKGGYACLSENWLRVQMRTNPFVVLKKVRI